MSTWRDALPRQTPPSSTAFCWFLFPLVPPHYLPPGSHHRLPPSSLLDLLSNSLTTAHPGPSHCVPPVSSPFPGPNSPSPPSPPSSHHHLGPSVSPILFSKCLSTPVSLSLSHSLPHLPPGAQPLGHHLLSSETDLILPIICPSCQVPLTTSHN